MADQDGKSLGQTIDKADDEEIHGAGAADGGEGVDAHSPADNYAVCKIVKLLQNTSRQHRQGKGQDQSSWAAFGHVANQSVFPLSLVWIGTAIMIHDLENLSICFCCKKDVFLFGEIPNKNCLSIWLERQQKIIFDVIAPK